MDNNAFTFSKTPEISLNLAEQKDGLLSAIIATSDDAIISKTLKGIITSWNPAAELMFGYSESETIGQHISIIIPPERLDEETYIIGQIAKGNRVNHFETVRLSRDGNLIPISLSISPILDRKGLVIGASKIARNIRERQIANEKNSILAAIVASSDDAIIGKTLEGIINSWNPAAERMFGYCEKDILGKNISLIIPPERFQEEAYIIGEVSKGNKVDHFQTVRIAKDGRQVHISLSVSPIVNESGIVVGASKIARDISEQQSIQREKERLFEQIKALNDKKDEFIGMASHELNTPLTSISSYLHILNKMVKDEKSRLIVEKSRRQVKKLSALVSELLDVSKIEAGRMQLFAESFDVPQVIKDAIELFSFSNESYNISFKTELSELKMTGDPHRIEQVLINLLSNAIRYSPGTNQIIIYLSRENKEVKIGIQDFGIGIVREKLKEVFTRFYRVEDTSLNVSGLGIGLFLSREIVLLHKGKIWAESEPGTGSIFWFTLPLD